MACDRWRVRRLTPMTPGSSASSRLSFKLLSQIIQYSLPLLGIFSSGFDAQTQPIPAVIEYTIQIAMIVGRA